jgi:hypothetical protein
MDESASLAVAVHVCQAHARSMGAPGGRWQRNLDALDESDVALKAILNQK